MSTTDAATSVVLRAHAKLTFNLRVTGVRSDGYHLIHAEMASLDLHDLITITPHRHGLTAAGPYADGLPLDRTNLVTRALDSVDAEAAIHIDKRIPHGGGLGGGSTDAATVLRWGGRHTDAAELVRASLLGADIPFCLVGGRALVSGIGEIIEPVEFVERTVTLVIPPFSVSTPAVYRAWDDLGGPSSTGTNDLEVAALAVEPRLVRWRRLIDERIGAAPILAGSGATWFIEGEHQDALADLVDEGARVLVARTVPVEVAAHQVDTNRTA